VSEQYGSNAWMEQWLNGQREMWTRMMSGASSMVAATMPSLPATQIAPDLLRALGPDVPESASEAAKRMLQLGDQYLGLTRGFWELLQSRVDGPSTVPPQDWVAQIDQMRRAMSGELTRLLQASAEGGALLSGWQQMAAAFGTAGPNAAAPFAGMFGMSADVWPKLTQAAARYQRAVVKMAGLLTQVGAESVDALAKHLTAGRKASPDSLSALHELWMGFNERAYRSAARAADFAAAQQELNESIAELRGLQRQIVEAWARGFQLPTRAEIDSVEGQVTTLKRRVRELEEEIDQLRRGR
jgi:hypothetical protein